MKNSAFTRHSTHGFARVATVCPRIHLGNPMENAKEHLALIRAAALKGAEFILCPEMGITGYDLRDLFQSTTLERAVNEALWWLAESTKDLAAIIAVGAPVIVDGKRANAAVVMGEGKILAIIPKTYLAQNGEFYEERVFTPARLFKSTSVRFFNQDVPFGKNILIQGYSPNLVIGLEICEDGWTKVSPGSIKMLSGATIIGNLSASNDLVGKGDARLRDVVLSASSLGYCAYMYASIGPGDGTGEVVYGGHCAIADRGTLIIEHRDGFDRKGGFLLADIDLEAIRKDRLKSNSYQECSGDFGQEMRIVRVENAVVPPLHDDLLRFIAPHPFVPSDPKEFGARAIEIERNMVDGLGHRLESLPPHMRKLVIGVSGGKDSSLSLKIACLAMDKLGLPRTDVIALTMPGFGTGDKTKKFAIGLMEALGVTSHEVSIKPVATLVLEALGYNFSTVWEERTSLERATFENVQAVTRFLTLASNAWWNGGIVDGTGTMSELALGFTTMFGDHAAHYNVMGSLAKTLEPSFIHWLADNRAEGRERELLHEIADQDATPELKPLEDGEVESTQISEVHNGPYELHDFFKYYFVRFGLASDKIAFMAWHAFRAGAKKGICREYSIGEVRKWILVFLPKFFGNQFKRNCVPESPMLGTVALSPRGYWRMPSDAQVDIWVKEAEAIETE